MIGVLAKVTSNVAAVQKAVEKAEYKTLTHGAASIRKDAIASIVPGSGPSAPGTPPHTHTQKITKRGKNKGKVRAGVLPRSILFKVDRAAGVAVVGTSHRLAGESGKPHEIGGPYKKERFDKRPFMVPAMTRQAARFGGSYASSSFGA
jgi:hypothetical protein